IRLKQRGQNAHHRCFTRAIGAEHPQNGACLYHEVEPVQGSRPVIRFGQSFCQDGWWISHKDFLQDRGIALSAFRNTFQDMCYNDSHSKRTPWVGKRQVATLENCCIRNMEAKMTHEQTDLRVRRTRANVRDALLDLIEEQGFDAVTVGNIAERAMVNRATFYRHYPDKYALVTGIFEEAVNQMLREVPLPRHLEAIARAEDGAERKAEQLEVALTVWTALFEH